MHAQYKVGVADNISTLKEYTGVQGIRPDFVDFNTRTIEVKFLREFIVVDLIFRATGHAFKLKLEKKTMGISKC